MMVSGCREPYMYEASTKRTYFAKHLERELFGIPPSIQF